MTMHLEEGTLRAYIDQQLAESERNRAASHLSSCAVCRTRAEKMLARSSSVAARLGVLDAIDPQEHTAPSPHLALARFKEQRLRKEIPLMNRIFAPRYRVAWGVMAAIVLIAGSMSFEPVRVWAGGLLAQFRVERITVLPIDPTRLTELGTNETLARQISQLLSDSMTVTKQPTKPRVVAGAAEASQAAGFAVRLPTSRTDSPRITVQGGTAFQFTVNRQRAQALMNELGYSRLQLPASLDGALIKANIPLGVTAAYGSCPKLEQIEESPIPAAPRAPVTGSAGRTMINCTIFSQIPSPTVDTPPQVDVQQLAEIGLQFTGMTQEQARSFSKTVDWTSTLVVPVPRNAASYKQVTVDGADGYLIQRPMDDAPQYALIWVKSGIIYAIGGLGSDTAAALQMGNSLK
jgi:hypothetical protein